MKSNNAKTILPPINNNTYLQNNSSHSPTNIIKEQKDKSDSNNNNNLNNNKFPNIKSINNSLDLKKNDKNEKNEDTNTYIEEMKKGTYNILVCVRCRPLSSLEYQLSTYETIRIMDNKMVILMDPIEYNGPNTVFKNRSREQAYAFDYAFDKYTTQNTVFEKSTKFLIEGVVNGYNATVFAYGATGAGKTYTMLGKETNPGIMPLTLKELFNKVKLLSERQYKLKFWYLEIYNENIRDLLKFMNQTNSNNNIIEENEILDLREDPVKGIIISGITEINVNNSNDMLKILKRGNRNRTQEATGANETSSRSHAILQVAIEYKDKNSGIDFEIKYSKLSLIDLAGSERASATQNRGIRLIEGANINRSLLTLGNCINALCDAISKGIKKPYIPYRDSKLTRLLKDSLGGNARTVMIANISPSINTFDDTYNTLKYANRAKNIKTVVSRNVLNAQYHISNYVSIINNLKNEISQLKQQIALKSKNNINENLINNINNNVNSINNSLDKNRDKVNEKDKENIINNNKLFDNEDKFTENIKEIKELCKNQIAVKHKILSTKNEINKLSEVIEMNKDISTINNGITYIINQTDKNSNNNPEGSLKNIDNNTNQILDNENDKNSKLNHLKEKMDNFQKKYLDNQNRFKEIDILIDKVININFKKYNYSEIQKEFLNLLIKNTNYKIQLMDNKFNNMINKMKNDIKDEYIEELEKQIEYRDEIIKEYKINISNSKMRTIIKELDNLKNEYKNKIEKAYISQNNSLFQIPNINNSIPYNNSLTNPNNYNIDQIYSTINGNSKRTSSQSRKKNNNILINKANKNIPNNRIPSNYIRGSGNSIGLIKNSSCSKISVKKFQNNNLNGINKQGGTGIINNGNNIFPSPNSNIIFGKNNININNINNSNSLKRNPKSFVYNNNINKEHFNNLNNNMKKEKIKENTKRHKSAIGGLNVHNHNSSYNEDDYYYICNKNNFKFWSDRLMTAEQLPQFKKSDINIKINEKNIKRQKFLDRINSNNKDIL